MPSAKYFKLAQRDSAFAESEVKETVPSLRYKAYNVALSLLLLLNIILSVLWYRESACFGCRGRLVYSPYAKDAQYERRRLFRDMQENVFAGPPRPAHDAAWRTIVEPMTIRISSQELREINETSIPLRDRSGYIAEMAVYHELHCIKRIRRHLYFNYYYQNMTEDQRLREGPHNGHCLEYLREAAICRGEASLATFQWADGKPYSHIYSDHECVVWEQLDAWARDRMVEMSDYSILAPYVTAGRR